MRAIAIADLGSAPALIDLPIPEPGPGEVRVRVRASLVNGFDAAVAGGYPDQHPAAVAVMADPDSAGLDRLAADVVAGRLRVPTHQTYGLADVPSALAEFSAGTLGKLGVTLT